MEISEHPLRHFEMMVRLAVRLGGMRAQILEHSYHYSGFGSWWVNFSFAGALYRVVLDVRESELLLERSPDPRRQEFKTVAIRRLVRGADVEALVNGLLDSLAAGAV